MTAIPNEVGPWFYTSAACGRHGNFSYVYEGISLWLRQAAGSLTFGR